MNALRLYRTTDSTGRKLQVRLVRIDIPTPNEDEVLIKVHASALNPSDILNSKGGFPYTTFTDDSRTLGRDYAGIIEDAPGAKHLIGMKVYGSSGDTLGFTRNGTHADFLVMPRYAISKMPENLTFAQAGSLGVVYTTALTMLEKASLGDYMKVPSFSVLIVGGRGNVGSALRQLLQAEHSTAIIFAADREDGTIKFAEGQSYDVIFSTVPDTSALQVCTTLLAKRGRLVFIASTRGTAVTSIQLDPLQFYRNQLSLIGVNSVLSTLQEVKVLMDNLAALIEGGRIQIKDEHEMQIAQLSTAVQHYESATSKLTFSMENKET